MTAVSHQVPLPGEFGASVGIPIGVDSTARRFVYRFAGRADRAEPVNELVHQAKSAAADGGGLGLRSTKKRNIPRAEYSACGMLWLRSDALEL